jgi:hypothetical protein
MNTPNVFALGLGFLLAVIHFFSGNLSLPEGDRLYPQF